MGAVDIWLKLSENDRYKRKVEALVVDGIDEELILGVHELKLVGLLDPKWPFLEVSQGQGAAVYSLKQAELTEEELLQEKVDMMEDTEEDYPEGEAEEIPEGCGTFARRSTQWRTSQGWRTCQRGSRRC